MGIYGFVNVALAGAVPTGISLIYIYEASIGRKLPASLSNSKRRFSAFWFA